MTHSREGARGSILEDQIHVRGGVSLRNRKTSEVFNTNDGWASGQVTSQDSYLSCASQINATHAAITGGEKNPGWMTIVTREGEVAQVAMEPVWGHACVAIPGGIMIAGGFSENYTNISNKTKIYDFEKNKWEETADMIVARATLSKLLILNKEVWAFGGLTSDGVTGSVEKFNLETREW